MRLEVTEFRLERLQILLELGAQCASLYLGELLARRLDLVLSLGQALLEVRREILNQALDLRDRRWVDSQADGQVGEDAAVLDRDLPAGGRDVLTFVFDQLHELLVRHADGVCYEVLHTRRCERSLRDVQGELPSGGRQGTGQRVDAARKLLFELGLDIDVGVQLIDQVDAERLLHILVREDLVGRVHDLVRLEHLALHPVRGERDDQEDRREHDQGPHERPVTPLRLRAPCGLRRGRRRSLGWGGVGLVGHCRRGSRAHYPVSSGHDFIRFG